MGAGAAALGAVLYPGPSATAEPLQNPTSTPAEKGRAHTQLGLPEVLPIWSPRYPQRAVQAVSHSPCVRSSLHIATRRSLCTKATRRVFGGQTFDCSLFGFGCCVVFFFSFHLRGFTSVCLGQRAPRHLRHSHTHSSGVSVPDPNWGCNARDPCYV